MSPALAGGFLTTEPPGKSQKWLFRRVERSVWLEYSEGGGQREAGGQGWSTSAQRSFLGELGPSPMSGWVLLLSFPVIVPVTLNRHRLLISLIPRPDHEFLRTETTSG